MQNVLGCRELIITGRLIFALAVVRSATQLIMRLDLLDVALENNYK